MPDFYKYFFKTNHYEKKCKKIKTYAEKNQL